ncbi:Acetamidase [Yarrowia sp. C11]|nr:Acetamidase [Yarrowia sp. E02]KAG5367479.1 Acetamidase [Yarrowia sp. C11]
MSNQLSPSSPDHPETGFEHAKKIYENRLESSILRANKLFPAPKDTPEWNVPEKLPLDVIPLFRSLVAPSDLEIVSLDGLDLITKLKSGSLKCVDVIGSFIRAAIIAHKLVNCLTEVLPDLALKTAQQLDESRDSKSAEYSLFGLPVSLKELISLSGLSCHAQNSYHIDRVVSRDSTLVSCLYSSGAIPYVRTNGPQILMSGESHSPLHGYTLNPHNTVLSSGGSSSGEGALISIGVSKLGLGTDIGGSVREPASFCGIYSLRPTFGRLSETGVDMMMAGNESIRSVCGPMSTDLRLIEVYMQDMGSKEVWKIDPSVDRWVWRKLDYSGMKTLRIGYCVDDGFVKAFPPIQKGILRLIEKLQGSTFEGLSVEVSPYNPPNIATANKLLDAFYFPDGCERIKNHFQRFQEPITPQTQNILNGAKTYSFEELWQMHQQRDEFRVDFHQDFTSRFDVVIYPVNNSVAPVFDTSNNLMYSGIWNLMDYPAVVVPTGSKVCDFSYEKNGEFRSELEKECWTPWVEQGPDVYKNAPVCVQIVAPRWEDELAVNVAKWVDQKVKEGEE